MEIDAVPAEAEAEPMEVDEQLFPVRPVPSWAQQIMAYLAEGQLPADETEARRIVGRSKGYTIINSEGKITKLCDYKAKLRVKRTDGKWNVTQFIEEHTHEVIQKFQLKKYVRSHKKIPKEEMKFIELQ